MSNFNEIKLIFNSRRDKIQNAISTPDYGSIHGDNNHPLFSASYIIGEKDIGNLVAVYSGGNIPINNIDIMFLDGSISTCIVLRNVSIAPFGGVIPQINMIVRDLSVLT